jgi:Uma2 family endonuclease
MWLDAGVRLVWVVYPARREIVIHRADSATTLTETDTLKGEDVVPGFMLPVADVFGG